MVLPVLTIMTDKTTAPLHHNKDFYNKHRSITPFTIVSATSETLKCECWTNNNIQALINSWNQKQMFAMTMKTVDTSSCKMKQDYRIIKSNKLQTAKKYIQVIYCTWQCQGQFLYEKPASKKVNQTEISVVLTFYLVERTGARSAPLLQLPTHCTHSGSKCLSQTLISAMLSVFTCTPRCVESNPNIMQHCGRFR